MKRTFLMLMVLLVLLFTFSAMAAEVPDTSRSEVMIALAVVSHPATTAAYANLHAEAYDCASDVQLATIGTVPDGATGQTVDVRRRAVTPPARAVHPKRRAIRSNDVRC